jgi:serine-type D-Ala-D-Ala carboxypeptidase/endopeptidase (penicillin-binding protein 4)
MPFRDLLCSIFSLFASTFALAQTSDVDQILLPDNIQQLLLKHNIPADALAIRVESLQSRQVLFQLGQDRAIPPASTMKVLTAAAALDLLGPTFRTGVELRTSAAINRKPAAIGEGEPHTVLDRTQSGAGLLKGDLYLRGLGHTDFDWEVLSKLLQALRNKGIHTLQGNVVIDRSYYEPARTDVGTPPFDEAPEFRYNIIPDALMLNSNLLQFELESDQDSLNVEIVPALDRVKIVNKMKLIERTCSAWEDGWKIPTIEKTRLGVIEIHLSGEFPKNCTINTNINVLDRADFAERLFRTLWRKLGGRMTGRVTEGVTPTGTRLVAEHKSRVLAEVLRDVLKRSDNPMTRMTFLTLGAESLANQRRAVTQGASAAGTRIDKTNLKMTSATTFERADRVMRDWLKNKGISDDGLVIENGSGLSRTEMIRPSQLASALRASYESKWRYEFMAAMPIAAIDGTIRGRFKNTPLSEQARLKTGTLKDVVALAGFVQNPLGEPRIVIVMLNHERAASNVGRPIVDAIAQWASQLPEPTAPSSGK